MKERGMYVKTLQDIKKKYNWTDNDLKDKGIWNATIMDPYTKYLSESNTKYMGGKAGIPFLPNLPEAILVTPTEGADMSEPMPDEAAQRAIRFANEAARAVLDDTRITPSSTRADVENVSASRSVESGTRSRQINLLEEKGPPLWIEPPRPSAPPFQQQGDHTSPEQAPAPSAPPASAPPVSTLPVSSLPARLPPAPKPRRRFRQDAERDFTSRVLGGPILGIGQLKLRAKIKEILQGNPLPDNWENDTDYLRRVGDIIKNTNEFKAYRPRGAPTNPPASTPSASAQPAAETESKQPQQPSTQPAPQQQPTQQATRDDLAKAMRYAADVARRNVSGILTYNLSEGRRSNIISRVIKEYIAEAAGSFPEGQIMLSDLGDISDRFGQSMTARISKALEDANKSPFDESKYQPPTNQDEASSAPPMEDLPPVRPSDPSYEDTLLPPDKMGAGGKSGFPVIFHPPKTPTGGVIIPPNPNQATGGGMPIPNPWRPPYGQPDGEPREEKKAGGGGAPMPFPYKPQPYQEPDGEPDDRDRRVRERPIPMPPPEREPEPRERKKPPKDEPPEPPSGEGQAAPDANKKQGGYGYLMPFFSDYHGIDLLTQTNAERIEDIKEFDLFDLPVEENTTLDNPLFRHELRNKMFRFSGIATDPTFYKGTNLQKAQFIDPPEVMPTINTFTAANQLEDSGPDAPNLWYNPYNYGSLAGRPLVSDAYRTSAGEGEAMIDQLNIYPELEQLAKYKPDAAFNIAGSVSGFVRPVKFDALESY